MKNLKVNQWRKRKQMATAKMKIMVKETEMKAKESENMAAKASAKQ
jgi:hypothetical protein